MARTGWGTGWEKRATGREGCEPKEYGSMESQLHHGSYFLEYGALNVVPVVFESCWFRLLLSLVQPNRLNVGQLLSFNTSHS